MNTKEKYILITVTNWSIKAKIINEIYKATQFLKFKTKEYCNWY